jgi:ferritin-like metal-binding protein YciE
MNGILQEGKELLRHFENTDVCDLALIHAGQKVEHFEIANYKMLRLLAKNCGFNDLLELVDESIREETAMADKLLNMAASSFTLHPLNI